MAQFTTLLEAPLYILLLEIHDICQETPTVSCNSSMSTNSNQLRVNVTGEIDCSKCMDNEGSDNTPDQGI